MIINTPDYYDPASLLWHAEAERDVETNLTVVSFTGTLTAAADETGDVRELADTDAGEEETGITTIRKRVRMPFIFGD